MDKPRVLIIYLCYGNLAYLDEVVSSYEKLDYPKDRVTVMFVPNGSPDGIADVIRERVVPRSGQDFPEVVLVDDGENRGFAGGNNHGMQYAVDHGFDYVFLNNGDLKVKPDAISKLVETCEADKAIASAQSLVVYWHEPSKVNVAGGIVHVAGYGYARDNLKMLGETDYAPVEEIAYASGAAVLYRVSVLKEVGFLEEGFFMYHEDLELGWRMRIAGYKNVLVSGSVALHDYSFSRNPKKFAWTELYRWIVNLAYYKKRTQLIVGEIMKVIEVGTWIMAIRGGWLKAKWWAFKEWFKPRTWKLLFSMRKRAQRLRKVDDRELLKFVVGTIEAQEQHNWIVDRIANPVIDWVWRHAKKVIRW